MKKFKKYDKEIKFLIRCAKESYKIIKNNKKIVSFKGKNDLVTNLDLAVEKFIIAEIHKKYPNFDVVSEEFNSKKQLTNNCFTIDPIDGTINFANDLPLWSIQIGCIIEGETVASVIFMPEMKRLYFAVKNQGAYLNGKRIFCKEIKSKLSIFSIECSNLQLKSDLAKSINKSTGHNLRTFSAVSCSYAFLASGSLSGHIFLGYTAWDVVPGILMCEEAGVKIFKKENYYTICAKNNDYINILKEKVENLCEKTNV